MDSKNVQRMDASVGSRGGPATSVEIRLDKIGYAAKAQLNVRTEDPVGLRPGRINN